MVGIEIHARVGEKGQIVIPKPIRDQLSIRPEMEMTFDVDHEKIILTKKKDQIMVYEDFISACKKKLTPPKKIDWKAQYYSQFTNK